MYYLFCSLSVLLPNIIYKKRYFFLLFQIYFVPLWHILDKEIMEIVIDILLVIV